MKITLVNYEKALGIDGILTKYTREMEMALNEKGHDVEVSDKPLKGINHHINYESYIPSKGKDTTMITHIDSDRKLDVVKKSLKTSVGVCFSDAMKKRLVKEGCPEDKLEVVLPAHDGILRRPRIIMIATNLYPDGRKREEMFVKLVKSLKDQEKFAFRIMGKGWKDILKDLSIEGVRVQLVEKFIGEFYLQLLSTSDYLLYTGGEDALAQCIIDAKNAGLRIIAAPQDDIDVELPFKDQKELNDIFDKLQENPVEAWTWNNYVEQHLKIWATL